MNAVILAGGTGTRLWPLSRRSRPKQFTPLLGDEPMIRDTYRRLLRLFPAEQIYFSVTPEFDALIHEVFPEVEDDHIFIEPEKRDTGPAMGYVAALMELLGPDEPMVFIPSDHAIADEELFLKTLSVGEHLVRSTGKLVDIAIEPTFPSTALGYTKLGPSYDTIDGVEVFTFAEHKEKPDVDSAKQYVASGEYLWHANYYMWTPSSFMKAIEAHAPEMGYALRAIQTTVRTTGSSEEVAQLYHQLERISFDYAVTEHVDPAQVLILKGTFGWDDIGTWDRLHEQLSVGGENVTRGDVVVIESTRSVMYAQPKKTLAVVGLDDVVVVDTPDATLVCRKDLAPRVKDLVEQLKQQGRDDIL